MDVVADVDITLARNLALRDDRHYGHATEPMTASAKLHGRFGKQDLFIVAADDTIVAPPARRSHPIVHERGGARQGAASL